MKKRKALELNRVLEIQRKFVRERDWEKFHTPKNITIALGIEASELMEIFLWLTDQESKDVMKNSKTAAKIREEIADVFFWLVRLSDVLDLELNECFFQKMGLNHKKYPVKLAKGKMTKYTEL